LLVGVQRPRLTEEEFMTHCEMAAMAAAETMGSLDDLVLLSAHVYLGMSGAVPRPELVRVLASHLEVGAGEVSSAIDRLAIAGLLLLPGDAVSLAAGEARESQEG
jgi:hypothetical protein